MNISKVDKALISQIFKKLEKAKVDKKIASKIKVEHEKHRSGDHDLKIMTLFEILKSNRTTFKEFFQEGFDEFDNNKARE